jgi:hypothetical protein
MEPRPLVAESSAVAPAVVTSRYDEPNAIVEGSVEGDVALLAHLPLPSELVAAEDMSIVREIRAKVERVDAKLSSLQAVVAETRAWTKRVELVHQAQQAKEAEERAARIIADAEERARQLLAAAERAIPDVAAASSSLASAPEPEVREAPHEARQARELSIEEQEAEALYDAIELFTRTNAEVVNELSELLKTLPAREQRQENG